VTHAHDPKTCLTWHPADTSWTVCPGCKGTIVRPAGFTPAPTRGERREQRQREWKRKREAKALAAEQAAAAAADRRLQLKLERERKAAPLFAQFIK
jgi:hypothetical protein